MNLYLVVCLALITVATSAQGQVCYLLLGNDGNNVPFTATTSFSKIPANLSTTPGTYTASFSSSPYVQFEDNSPLDVITVTSGTNTYTFNVFTILITYSSNAGTDMTITGTNVALESPHHILIGLHSTENLFPNGLTAELPPTSSWSPTVYFNSFGTVDINDLNFAGQVTTTGNCATQASSCILPTGEVTVPPIISGGNGNDVTVIGFHQVLLPTTVSFAGRRIQEVSGDHNGISGTDGCQGNFPMLNIGPFTEVTGPPDGSWIILSDNSWGVNSSLPLFFVPLGYDRIGLTAVKVRAYQGALRARALIIGGLDSCQIVLYQQMQISCSLSDLSWMNYGPINTLSININPTNVTVIRARIPGSVSFQ